jgi:Ca2+-binding RTX toxin-like protein
MIGGGGNDTYVVDNLFDVVQESSSAGGTDIVNVYFASYTLGANVENLALGGTLEINGTGNALPNTIIGNSAANVINGGAGADIMKGGAGNDTYIVDNLGDTVSEFSAAYGVDLVKSRVNFTLGSNIENLTLGGTALLGTGNGLANVITGNIAGNTLKGEAGADTLSGLDGNDKLYGGAGKDSLTGGAGYDRFYFDAPLSASTNVDTIGDFSAPADSIYLDRSIFKGIMADGAIGKGAFALGTAATELDDRILYDKDTGRIFYDADGSKEGGVSAILFAQVTAGTSLTNLDFIGYTGG